MKTNLAIDDWRIFLNLPEIKITNRLDLIQYLYQDQLLRPKDRRKARREMRNLHKRLAQIKRSC